MVKKTPVRKPVKDKTATIKKGDSSGKNRYNTLHAAPRFSNAKIRFNTPNIIVPTNVNIFILRVLTKAVLFVYL